MADKKKYDCLPRELSLEILLSGAVSLEEADPESGSVKALKAIIEHLIENGEVHSQVAVDFKKRIEKKKKEREKMNRLERDYSNGECTEVIERNDAGYSWRGVRNDTGYVIFERKYEPGCPFVESQLNPVEVQLDEGDYPSPVYQKYLFWPTQSSGLSVKMLEGGFFKVRFCLDPFSEDRFFITETGAWPLSAEDSSVHMGFRDCEPHSYRTNSILDVNVQIYRTKTYRDGVLQKEYSFSMEQVFSGNPIVRDERLLKLFSLLEKNLAVLQKHVAVESRLKPQGYEWKMADGSLVPAVPCSCTGTGVNGTSKDSKFYQNELYYDGESVYKVCSTCGANEKLF